MKKIFLLSTVFIWCVQFCYSQPGQLDSSFGTKGIVTAEFGGALNNPSSGDKVLLQPDGSMDIIGHADGGGLFISKRHPDGTRDLDFGQKGFLSIPVAITLRDAAMQPDGKIVLAGWSEDYYNGDFAVARLTTDGTVDSSFALNGMQLTDFNSSNDKVFSIAIQSDGKIVLAGNVGNEPNSDFGVARYNPNGSLDKTFDGDGILVDDYLHYDNNVTSLTFYNNKIYVGGYSFLPEQNGVLTRYLAGSSLPVTKSLQRNLVTEKSELIVKAHPNPSTQYFTLSLNGGENNPASVKVIDAGGRLIELKNNLAPNTSLQIGAKYKPGIYYVEINQGTSKKLLQLVKQ